MGEDFQEFYRESVLPPHLLVIGVDGSGKSTFLDTVSSNLGYKVIEPTSSTEAREFKRTTIDQPITYELVEERERIYLALNEDLQTEIFRKIQLGDKIATSGDRIVTQLSHAVMRQTISPESDIFRPEELVSRWVRLSQGIPDAIVFTHAPFDVIRARITERQSMGYSLETFWGFNAPFYLDRYQDAWHDVLEIMKIETDIGCNSYDTSSISPVQMLVSFAKNQHKYE